MSNCLKLICCLIILAFIILGLWYFLRKKSPPLPEPFIETASEFPKQVDDAEPVPINDQEAFAKWLFEAKPTCKENQLYCLRYEDLRYSRPNATTPLTNPTRTTS